MNNLYSEQYFQYCIRFGSYLFTEVCPDPALEGAIRWSDHPVYKTECDVSVDNWWWWWWWWWWWLILLNELSSFFLLIVITFTIFQCCYVYFIIYYCSYYYWWWMMNDVCWLLIADWWWWLLIDHSMSLFHPPCIPIDASSAPKGLHTSNLLQARCQSTRPRCRLEKMHGQVQVEQGGVFLMHKHSKLMVL